MRRANLLAGASRRVAQASQPIARRGHPQVGFCHHTFDQYVVANVGLSGRSYSALTCRATASNLFSHPTRSFSTNTTPNTPETSKVDPLTPNKPKKAKVELRPGPIKTENTSKTSAKAAESDLKKPEVPPSTSQPHPTKPPPSTSFRKEVLAEAEGKSIVEQTKNDIDDGTRHGILAPPPTDAGMVGKLWHTVKELFKFYWAGLKYIRSHREEAKKIQWRISTGGAPLTWREHRFIRTNNADMVKVIPFILVALILEEVIPLIVMYIPGMLPSTCILPSQRLRIEAKRHERQREAHERARTSQMFADIDFRKVCLKSLNSERTSLLCSMVGISSWGILPMQRRRLRQYLQGITEEDTLLRAEDLGAKLRQEEVSGAIVDRGFVANFHSPTEERSHLKWWLENVQAVDFGAKPSSSSLSPEDVRVRLLVHMLSEKRL